MIDRRRRGGRSQRTARAGRRAASTRSATAARAATPTWWRPSRGCPDGTPFPTTFYLTCPRAASLIGTLEASGADEGDDGPARAATPTWPRRTGRRTRTTWPAARRSATSPRSPGSRAGGMPTRVKCLHVLAGQSLAAGPGVNPLGDEVLDAARRLVAVRPLRRRWRRRATRDPGRRGRLRHQHRSSCWSPTSTPAAGDRGRAWSGRCASSGSARTSTAPAGSPTRRWRGCSRPSRSTPRLVRAARRRRAPVRARPRPSGTPSNVDEFVARRRAPGSAWSPRWSPAPRRPRCPTTARPAALARRTGSGGGARHRRRLDRADPGRRARPRHRGAGPSTSARCG